MLAGVVFGQIDRIIINNYIGSHETGLFSFASLLATVSGVFIVSIRSSWEPKFMNMLNTKSYNKIDLITSFNTFIVAVIISITIIFFK